MVQPDIQADERRAKEREFFEVAAAPNHDWNHPAALSVPRQQSEKAQYDLYSSGAVWWMVGHWMGKFYSLGLSNAAS